MFGLLFSTVMHVAAAIDKYVRDKKSMSSPMYYDSEGRAVYMDTSRNKYINGEKVISKFDYKTGVESEVGSRTGTVYFNSRDSKAKIMREQYDNRRLYEAEKEGKLACKLWHPEYDQFLTTELSTGKIIVCLYEDIYTGECRKFYYKGGYERFISNGCFMNSKPGDMGIVITKEEYDKLYNREQTCATIPRWETCEKLKQMSEEKRLQEEKKKRIPHKPIPCNWKTNTTHSEDDNISKTKFIY